jgi:hypothetical protein
MSRVLPFSTKFPAYHKRAGEQTFFVEKLLKMISVSDANRSELVGAFNKRITDGGFKTELADYKICASAEPKYHTIRAGHRWKAGDLCSPRVWSGVPYQEKQIVICDDIEVKKVWNFNITIHSWDVAKEEFAALIYLQGKRVAPDLLLEIAKNDGLELGDFLAWFKFPMEFDGQVICFDSKINYDL